MPRESSTSVKVFYPKYNTEAVVGQLKAGIEKLKEVLPLKLVVLFGSYARGNYTVASDIDLLVVYRGERREDAYALTKRILDIPRLEPHIYSEKEYQQIEKTFAKMTRGGVVIYG